MNTVPKRGNIPANRANKQGIFSAPPQSLTNRVISRGCKSSC
jgi:hypothetical protein